MNHRKSDLIPHGPRPSCPDFGRFLSFRATMALFLGCLLFLGACDQVNGTREKETTPMTKMNSVPKVSIPPIDASAPTKIETATFGLG